MLFRLMFCFFLTSFFPVLSFAIDCQKNHCLAIVDAGSSGSRLHIYTVQAVDHQLPKITEEWVKKITPGISTVLLNPETIDLYMTQLFSNTPALPANTPLYFYATAGMRLQSQPYQQQLYSLIDDWFAKQQQWNLKDAKTITGHEEGLYGWLSVNYKLDSLTSDKTALGVMDMGGASVQLSFPVDKNKISADTRDFTEVDLLGHHYTLFIHSFLGLGQNEMSHQFLTNKECFSQGYITPDSTPANGDAYRCKDTVSPLINNVQGVNALVLPIAISQLNQQWQVMGGIVDLAKDPEFALNESFTSQELLDAGNKVCKQSWDNLHNEYPMNNYLYEDCLMSAYYYSLIADGYGIASDKPLNYSRSGEFDWTVGAVLNLMLPELNSKVS